MRLMKKKEKRMNWQPTYNKVLNGIVGISIVAVHLMLWFIIFINVGLYDIQ